MFSAFRALVAVVFGLVAAVVALFMWVSMIGYRLEYGDFESEHGAQMPWHRRR